MSNKLLQIEKWWNALKIRALIFLSYLMALLALLKLGDEFARLLFEVHENSAVDLKIFAIFTQDWFAGHPVYKIHPFATYPPASYVILWPLFGNFTVGVLRIVWAIISVGLLIWLAKFSIRAGRAQSKSRPIQYFLALIPLSFNSLGVTIGNGQLTLIIIALIWFSIKIATEEKDSRSGQLVAAFLFLMALVKPSLSVPILLAISICSWHFMPSLAAAAGNGLVTLFSSLFQAVDIINLLSDWIGRAVEIDLGYANIHNWLRSIEMQQLSLPL